MNKQQLAAKIWESANQMRSKIEANEYNLNIPRYVDSSEPAESWDLYASMFGGIPSSELDTLIDFWKAFPNLRAALFADNGTPTLGWGEGAKISYCR